MALCFEKKNEILNSNSEPEAFSYVVTVVFSVSSIRTTHIRIMGIGNLKWSLDPLPFTRKGTGTYSIFS
jgi:hypothetical protein